MSDIKIRDALMDRLLYIHASFRVIILPLLAYASLFFTGLEKNFVAVLIMCIDMPSPATLAVFVRQGGGDEAFTSQLIFLSTVASVLTIPVFAALLVFL